MENSYQPITQASREKVMKIPIEVGVYICGVANKYRMINLLRGQSKWIAYWSDLIIKSWKNVKNLLLRQWMECNQKDYFEQRLRF